VSVERMRAAKAEWAHEALRSYGSYDPADLATTIVDFLSDAMHLAEARGLDFAALVQSAERHYHAEGGAGHTPDDIAECAADDPMWRVPDTTRVV
jgi:hypothetical protein